MFRGISDVTLFVLSTCPFECVFCSSFTLQYDLLLSLLSLMSVRMCPWLCAFYVCTFLVVCVLEVSCVRFCVFRLMSVCVRMCTFFSTHSKYNFSAYHFVSQRLLTLHISIKKKVRYVDMLPLTNSKNKLIWTSCVE